MKSTLNDKYKNFKYDSQDHYIQAQHEIYIKKEETEKQASKREFAHKSIKRYCPANIKSILCIGARHAAEVQYFIDKGYDAHGIDLWSDTPLISVCDMAQIHKHPLLKNKKFDLFMAIHSLEHCSDIPGFIESLNLLCTKSLYVELPASATIESIGRDDYEPHATGFEFVSTKSGADAVALFPEFKVSYISGGNRNLVLIMEKKFVEH